MKPRKLLFYIALVQMCTAATCGGGSSNDLLMNLYYEAFKSGNPLLKDPEPIYETMLGTWMVENDRMLVVTKRDDKCLFFRFLDPSLHKEDVTYKAYFNYQEKNKFISLLAYQEQFMYFKLEPDSGKNMKLQMVRNKIRDLNPTGTLASYLKKPGVDTLDIWRTIHLKYMNTQSRDAYIGEHYGSQVGAIENFDKFKNKFPEYPYLAQVRERSIQYTLNNTYSIKKLMDYANFYPEMAVRAKKAAKQKCTNTTSCIEYLEVFPNDPAKDSIVDIAFETRGTYEKNMEALLAAFPNDKRCAGFDYKLAYSESAKRRGSRYYSHWDAADWEARVGNVPSIAPMYFTLEKMNEINLARGGFLPCTYILSETGKKSVDSLITYVQFLNAKRKNISNLYFVINADTNNLNENGQVVYFKIAVNRCIYLRKLLEEKLPGVSVKCIPYIETSRYWDSWKHSGYFFTDIKDLSDERSCFSSTKNSLGNKHVKIDTDGTLRNTEFLPESELIDMILETLPDQINLYLKQQPYTRIIPVNYWYESYKDSQPNFEKYKEKIMDKAAEKGFDVKKLQNFVME